MNEEMQPLTLDESFKFSCKKEVPCFNECCRDLNQFLTPYDILRLKKNLKISSTRFLEQYTTQHIGPETGMPIISFNTDHASELRCPFVTPSGCSVYQDRPGSCRTYPLVRLATRSRETGKITEYHMLLEEPHCKGFENGESKTVREWIEEQEIAPYNEMNDLLMEIIGLKNQHIPGQMDMKKSHLFHLACYDIDNFRKHIFEKGLLDELNLDDATLNKVKENDDELLKLGLKWIKQTLFNI